MKNSVKFLNYDFFFTFKNIPIYLAFVFKIKSSLPNHKKKQKKKRTIQRFFHCHIGSFFRLGYLYLAILLFAGIYHCRKYVENPVGNISLILY